MRYLLTLGIAALAAVALLPMTGCIDSANGLTDTIVFMSEAPFTETQTRVDTPWVWFMPADGANRLPIFDTNAPENGIGQGSFSPDGNTIVYSYPSAEILVYNLVTGQSTSIYTGANPLTPSYSPDGGTIVFSEGALTEGYQSLWTMSASGANPAELLAAEQGDNFLDPSYNRTGTKIVFQEGNTNDTPVIYIMDADGNNVTQLTNSGSNQHPSFLPDGRILYSHTEGAGLSRIGQVTPDIWIMDADGGNKRDLTNTPSVSETYPSSNYSGTAIAYANGNQFGGDILVAPFDGTDLGAPVNITTAYTDPCWRPVFGRVRTTLLDSIFNPISM